MGEKEQVKSRQRVVERGEVFTAEREVNDMLDMVAQECRRIDSRFLEPACGDGNFLAEILRRKLGAAGKKYDESPSDYEKNAVLAASSIYGVDIMLDNIIRCRQRMLEIWNEEYKAVCGNECGRKTQDDVKHIFEKNIVCGNALSLMRADENGCDTKLPIVFSEWTAVSPAGLRQKDYVFSEILMDGAVGDENVSGLKFDVIISNPPYQMNDGGAQASAKPLYHKFIQQAKKLNPRYLTMIVPSRWFAGGKGLDSFRNEMLHDTRICRLHDYPDASDCFPGVEIKGGVCYFLWDRDYCGECEVLTHSKGRIVSSMKRPLLEKDHGIFVRDNKAVEILKKVQKFGEDSFALVVSARKPFAFPTNFKDFYECRKNDSDLKIYANHSEGYIERKRVEKNQDWIARWKVLVPEAIGSGDTKTDRVNPILAGPGEICTETYLVVGPCESKTEAENMIAYIQTRFFHFMLGLKKITQHTTSKVYEFVPQQDFSIRWTDKLLYEKYGLTDKEAEYVEALVWRAE